MISFKVPWQGMYCFSASFSVLFRHCLHYLPYTFYCHPATLFGLRAILWLPPALKTARQLKRVWFTLCTGEKGVGEAIRIFIYVALSFKCAEWLFRMSYSK